MLMIQLHASVLHDIQKLMRLGSLSSRMKSNSLRFARGGDEGMK